MIPGKEIAKKSTFWIWVIWFAIQVLGVGVKNLVSLDEYLIIPFKWLVDWVPANDLTKWVFFNLCFWTYAGVFWLLWSFVLYILKKTSNEKLLKAPTILYAKELAATMNAIDREAPATDVEKELINLFSEIIEQMKLCLGLTDKDFRAMIVLPDPDNEFYLTGLRWGKKSYTSAEQERRDVKAMGVMDETNKTHTRWLDAKMQFENGDGESLIYIRNAGKMRLGCFIAILKPGVDMSDAKWISFEQVSYLFTMLGPIDKIAEVVVNYNQRRDKHGDCKS